MEQPLAIGQVAPWASDISMESPPPAQRWVSPERNPGAEQEDDEEEQEEEQEEVKAGKASASFADSDAEAKWGKPGRRIRGKTTGKPAREGRAATNATSAVDGKGAAPPEEPAEATSAGKGRGGAMAAPEGGMPTGSAGEDDAPTGEDADSALETRDKVQKRVKFAVRCEKCDTVMATAAAGVIDSKRAPQRFTCNRCNSKRVMLHRMFGTWPLADFEALSAEEQKSFWATTENTCKSLRRAVQDKLEKVFFSERERNRHAMRKMRCTRTA